MARIINEIRLHNGYVEVLVEKTGQFAYKDVMLIDIEDLHLIQDGVRVTNSRYAYTRGKPSKNVAHLVCNHISNMETIVDHINGNRLDNRKVNLRVITQKLNANNRSTSRNNTGIVGISLRSNGKYVYYRATVFDINQPTISGKTRSATKRYTKQFNISKLGKDIAFAQAKEWLKQKRIEFGYINP